MCHRNASSRRFAPGASAQNHQSRSSGDRSHRLPKAFASECFSSNTKRISYFDAVGRLASTLDSVGLFVLIRNCGLDTISATIVENL